MYSKIAINNVKRSFKDYAIYFLTISFAVCIFYSFNSIESQKALLDINKNQAEYISLITTLIAYVSVFVSFVLGGLILYANNFLIKKRKKELGIYMTLGMSKRKISKILLSETLIVGVLSLLSGLLLGLGVSKGLSLFTAKLFEVGMSEFKFVVSGSAILKTVLYFALIFGVLMIFNTRIISKYKLIDMLTAARKSEDITTKQQVEAQRYINQDEDPVAAIEYVNSEAFQMKYQAQLAQIQVKEQQLNIEKQQAETKQKMFATQQDGWEKLTENNIKKGFQYAH